MTRCWHFDAENLTKFSIYANMVDIVRVAETRPATAYFFKTTHPVREDNREKHDAAVSCQNRH